MALEQLHILLSYSCNFECDHCFVYSGPDAKGTFTLSRLQMLLDQAEEVDSLQWVYFEGGEAFLLYPLLVEGVRAARHRGYKVGIVTNGYWADSVENALLFLGPLAQLGIEDLSVSDDEFHHGTEAETPALRVMEAARRLDIPTGSITIDPPTVEDAGDQVRGAPVVGGSVMFRGRAVDKLSGGLPTRPWASLDSCPYEELEQPFRVHVDSYGHVQVCQGISIGNVWETPLARIVGDYDSAAHPVCGPLLRGGPAELARHHGVDPAPGYVDECHLCYLTRRSLLDELPEELAPAQVYGL